MPAPVLNTDFAELKLFRRGKVRDVYDLGAGLLIVATDRISAFDVVLPNAIPDKGRVLNQLSVFWFNRFKALVPNHIIATDVERFPYILFRYRDILQGRSMLVRKTQPLPVECVVRGYLAGTGWKDYQSTGKVCGLSLPSGLKESDRLPKPIFTPSTKAEAGHDENISYRKMIDLVGRELAETIREVSLKIYSEARSYAEEKGIIIADTKLEFGLYENKLMLIDEILTPDSSRFWSAEEYLPGSSPPSFDKQYVRNYLERIGWNKQPPAPELPANVIEGTRLRYIEAFGHLVGGGLV
jgi:phosphoribosylaminoimidazole-succinocarboxamide synthase